MAVKTSKIDLSRLLRGTPLTGLTRAGSGAGGPQAPIITALTLDTSTLPENSPEDTLVGTFSVTPDLSTLSLFDDVGGRLKVVGKMLLAGAVPSDFEATPTLVPMVRATYGTQYMDKPFTITVTDAVELLDITMTPNTMPEASPAGTYVGTLTSTPPGAVFTLIDDAGGQFALSGDDLVAGAVPTDYEANTSIDVIVTGTLGGETLNQTLTVLLSNVNEGGDITLSAATIAENSAAGTVVGVLTSTLTSPTYTIQAQTPSGTYFTLSGANLVAGATATNFEVNASHSVTIRATSGSDFVDKVFTITVTDVDEINDITLSAATVAENTAAGTTVGVLASVPTGATFSIVSQTPAGTYFAISGNNLQTGATPTNFEANTSHSVTIRGTRGSETYDEVFTITVTDVDEINDITLSANTVAENTAAGTTVGALTSTPAGAAFSIVSQTPVGTYFAISGTSLVTGATPTNFEANTSHSVTIRGTRLGETYDEVFTVNVTNVQEITDIALSAATVAENTAVGSTVGVLSSTPPGATYTITSQTPSGTYFAISGNNLQTGATPTDFEANASHSVTIQASLGADVYSEVFTITVTDVDEISAISLSANTVAENTAAGNTVGALTSTPTGATFAIQSQTPAGTYFAISGGNLVTGATPTNFEANTSHSVTVRGTRLGETFDQVFTVNVTNVQEITDIALSANTIAENTAAGTTVGALTSTPPGATYTITSQTPTGTYFAISGGNLVTGATPTNFEANTSHSVTIQASLGADVYSEVFTVNVTNVQEITDIALSANSIAENTAAGTTVGALTSTPPGATYSITSQTPAGTYFAISGGNLVTGATPTNFEVNASHSVTIQAALGSDVYSEVFSITVTDVDEISAINLSANSIAENTAAGSTVGVLSSTPAGATFVIQSQTPAGTYFAISGNNLQTGATPTNFEANTSHSVTVRGTRLSETFDQVLTINVTNVQEITDIALSANSLAENSAQGTAVGTFTSTPGGATFTLTDDAGGRFQVVSGALQAGATPSDFETATSYQITAQAALGADVFPKNFTINITDVQDGFFGSYPDVVEGPQYAQAGTAGVVGTLYMTPHVYSEDPNTGTFSILSDPSGLFSLTGGRSQNLNVTTGATDGGTYNISVQLTTPSTEVRTATITINGIAAGTLRPGGSGVIRIQGAAGGAASGVGAGGTTGGTDPKTYAWTKESTLPITFSDATAQSPTITITAGTGIGFYRGQIFCTVTDAVSATTQINQIVVLNVTS